MCSKVNRTYGWCVAWPLAAGTVAPAFGQTVGSIEGTVADGQGLRRHATLPQSWIQRENWEFETHRRRRLMDEWAAYLSGAPEYVVAGRR